jgi:hypothetical protein
MINVPQLIDEQSRQRLQWISFSKEVPANTTGSDTISISDDGHFLAHYIGGQYTSKYLVEEEATDSGACALSVKLHDNGRRWDIIDNPVPLSLFLTPGRQRTSGLTGDPDNPLFSPLEFEYLFLSGTTIRVEYANSSDYANLFWLIFYGEKLFKEFSAPITPAAE